MNDDRARALYEAVPVAKPAWDALGETTKGVWRERADADRLRLYDVLAANGPDVDAWSAAFTRLVNKAQAARLNFDDRDALYEWLDGEGLFGPKSDRLRAPGDKHY